MRKIIAIVVGFFAGMLLVSAGHILSSLMHPLPEDLNINDTEGLLAHIQAMPVKVILLIICFHIIAGFISSFLASRIADSHQLYIGFFVGLLFIVSTVSNAFRFPHSFWMTALDIFGVILFVFLGARMGSKSSSNS
ncbi:MAG: hypothetical protein KJO50_04035 [Bacteroidia bacterium]|nr:hypothetical protein [Bacteroidia bacterium]